MNHHYTCSPNIGYFISRLSMLIMISTISMFYRSTKTYEVLEMKDTPNTYADLSSRQGMS